MKIKEIIIEGPFAAVPAEEQGTYEYAWAKRFGRGNISGDPVDHKVLGVGCEAVVIKTPNDPSVVKIQGNAQAVRNNGYMQYLLLSRKYANSNPYLPQVQSIRKLDINRAMFDSVFAIKMEHLTPFAEIPEEHVEIIAQQIFSVPFLEKGTMDVLGDYYHIGNLIDLAICQRYGADKGVRDPAFIRVASLINKISSRTSSTIDLGPSNMMIRYTNGRPQLVITDPLL